MKLGFWRNDRQTGVVIISGSCCIPGMAPFDEQARRVVDQAIAETGVAAQVRMMPATTAYMGGAPKSKKPTVPLPVWIGWVFRFSRW